MACLPPEINADCHLHLVTGRLAEVAVQQEAESLRTELGIPVSVGVMPITVAALMTPKWLARHWQIPATTTHVVLPGYCEKPLQQVIPESAWVAIGVNTAMTWREHLEKSGNAKIVSGPNDCRDLGQWLTGKSKPIDMTSYSIEIIAEINHVPQRTIQDIADEAERLRNAGANRIDVGCDPSNRCESIGDFVSALVDSGHKVSIDTFDPWEAKTAIAAGASLVLSVNSTNRHEAIDYGAEVVVIPDAPDDLASMHETIDFLSKHNVPMRLDPILEPIGSGLTASLLRYASIRKRYPDHAMMMGIGNVTELTDVDSAGLNFLLLGICEELQISSVLTTQVINWARSSVRECDIARRLVHHSVNNQAPPKRLSDELVTLRDSRLKPHAPAAIEALAAGIRDNNYRLIAQDEEIHLLSKSLHLKSRDPFELFDALLKLPQSDNVDASHAFYLGYEMAKAATALQLSKQYEQDQSLRWGHLTIEEDLHRITRTSRHRNKS